MRAQNAKSWVIAATLAFGLPSVMDAQSQSFVAEPIAIDVDPDLSAQEDGLVIVAAYEAPNLTPRFGSSAGTGRDARVTAQGRPVPSIILGIVQSGMRKNTAYHV